MVSRYRLVIQKLKSGLTRSPLVDVAKAWGLSVDVFNGETANFLGIYRRRSGIALGVQEPAQRGAHGLSTPPTTETGP